MKLESDCSAPASLFYIHKICNAQQLALPTHSPTHGPPTHPTTDHPLTHPRTTHTPTDHPLTFLSCFSASCARDSLLERVLSLTMRRVALRERSPIFLLPSSGSEVRTSWRACTDNGGIEPYNTPHHIHSPDTVPTCTCTVHLQGCKIKVQGVHVYFINKKFFSHAAKHRRVDNTLCFPWYTVKNLESGTEPRTLCM